MGSMINLTGQRFGQLVVLGRSKKRSSCIIWECKCDCGAIVTARGNNLRTKGRISCCGLGKCLVGEVFGALTVIDHAGKNRGISVCRCSCGNVCKFENNEMLHGVRRSCANPTCTALLLQGKHQTPNNYIVGDQITEIELNSGDYAIIDSEDYDLVKNIRWRKSTTGAVKEATSIKAIVLARLLLRPSNNQVVDHIDHDPLNNRRSNLRVCTQHQNTMNSVIPSNNTSGFKGVSKLNNKKGSSYRACIVMNGKQISIGQYTNPIDAAIAYNKKAVELFGEFACVNKIPPIMAKPADPLGRLTEHDRALILGE